MISEYPNGLLSVTAGVLADIDGRSLQKNLALPLGIGTAIRFSLIGILSAVTHQVARQTSIPNKAH